MVPDNIVFNRDNGTHVVVRNHKEGFQLEATVLRYYYGTEVGGRNTGARIMEVFDTYEEALSEAERLIEASEEYMRRRSASKEEASELDRRAKALRVQDKEDANAYLEDVLGDYT